MTDAAAERPRKWHRAIRGNVLMMGLVSLFTDASSEMIYPLLPVFLNGLVATGAVAAYVGLMEGLAESAASLLKIFSGRLSDALGKRKALVVFGYGLSTICRPLMGAALAGWQVIGLRFGDRIGKGVRTSPRDALIGESVDPSNRGLAFSFHRAMDHTGAVIGPLLGYAVLAALVGSLLLWQKEARPSGGEMRALRIVFLVALIPGLAAMVALIFKVREIAPGAGSGAGATARRGDGATGQPKPGVLDAGKQKPPSKPTGHFQGWSLLPRRFYLFVGVVTLFALGNSSDLFILLYGQTAFGLGIAQVLALWVLLHVSKIAFSVPGGMLSDRLGRRPLIVAGWIVYALVYMGFAFVAGGPAWQFWALFAAYGVYYGMTEGAEKALVADFVAGEHYGTAYGVYHGAIGLAALPASLVFGVFWAVLGPQIAFGIGASLAGLAAVLLIVLLSAARRQRPGD